ncbi:TPA: phage head-tail adapter protein [Streptococcus agalactiae]|nr:phage head-tail adapter protein [Streptococcus agalactiae]
MTRRRTNNGDLRTPITFYSACTDDSLDGRDTKLEKMFTTFAEVYNPSIKDIETVTEQNVKAQFTIKLRDPLSAYIPRNDHLVEIQDSRLAKKTYEILNIRPDFVDRDFLVIVLGG